MTKPTKALFGAITVFTLIFPYLIVVVFFATLVALVTFSGADPSSFSSNGELNPGLFSIVMGMYMGIMCSSVVQVLLQVTYVTLVIKNREMSDLARILLVLGMFFLPIIAMPIFFVVYFWPEAGDRTPAPVVV